MQSLIKDSITATRDIGSGWLVEVLVFLFGSKALKIVDGIAGINIYSRDTYSNGDSA